MRDYEVMLILPAEADEATLGTAVDRVAKVIADKGGQIGKIDRWGRRRFAYEIAHQTEGYYAVVQFSAEPTDQTDVERVLRLADEVIRAKVTLRPPANAKTAVTSESKSESKKDASPVSA